MITLMECEKCEISYGVENAYYWADEYHCPICRTALLGDKYKDSKVFAKNAKHKKYILLVLDGLYVSGAHRHSLLLAEKFKKQNYGLIIISLDAGGGWFEKYREFADIVIVSPSKDKINWDFIKKNIDIKILNKIKFANAQLVQANLWCLNNLPNEIPLYSSFHCDITEHEYFGKQDFDRFLSRSKKLIFPAIETKRNFENYFNGKIDDYAILNNSLSVGKTTVPIKSNIDGNVAVVSRLDGDKFSIPLFIDSILQLKAKKLKFNVVVAGDGELRAELEQAVAKNNLQDIVTLKGFVYDINKIYDWANVVFMPSKTESMPYVMLEAFAKGIVVIMPNAGFAESYTSEMLYKFTKENAEEAAILLHTALSTKPKSKTITFEFPDDTLKVFDVKKRENVMIRKQGQNIFISNKATFLGDAKIGHCSILGMEDYKGNTNSITIGKNFVMGAYCSCEYDVVIGDDCELGNRCSIYAGARIGNNVYLNCGSKVYWNARIADGCVINGCVPQDVILEKNVRFFGRVAHSHRNHTIEWGEVREPSPYFCEGSFVGLGALIIGGVRIGRNSYVGAGEILRCNLPDESVFFKGKIYDKKKFRGFIL